MDKYYFSYEDIHKTIKLLSKQIISSGYKTDIIVAIGSGGFIPARMLKTFLDKPILAVGISYYNHENKTADNPSKVQWIEEAEKHLKGKNILLVDEVDDSRATLEYCIKELLKHEPAAISVAVLHNKIKKKKGSLPKELSHYFAGKTIEDKWVCYPWDAQDIDEHCALANSLEQKAETQDLYSQLSTKEQKKQLRKKLKSELKAIPSNKRTESGLALAAAISAHAIWKEAKLVLAFLSMPMEIETLYIIEAALSAGKRIACPRIRADEIEFVELDQNWKNWTRDAWDIPEPPAEDPALGFAEIAALPCLALIPGLGFDLKGSRIGWGKGYYDRFLAGMEKTRRDKGLTGNTFFKLGIGYSEQLREQIPVDERDLPLDGLALGSAELNFF